MTADLLDEINQHQPNHDDVGPQLDAAPARDPEVQARIVRTRAPLAQPYRPPLTRDDGPGLGL